MPKVSGGNRIFNSLDLGSEDVESLMEEAAVVLRERGGLAREGKIAGREKRSESKFEGENVRDILRHAHLVSSGYTGGQLSWIQAFTRTALQHLETQNYTPINLGDSVTELRHDVRRIQKKVEEIRTTVADLQAEMVTIKRIESAVSEIYKHIFDNDINERNWLQLAESSFAFWDNEEDAIYDEL